MTLPPRPAAGEQPCGHCGAPLAPDQRWCVLCGTRRADGRSDPFALLRGSAAANRAPISADHGPKYVPRTAEIRSFDAARRRKAALPAALAALVGLVVVTGTGAPSSLAESSEPPFTVVLPKQDAQQVAQAPPATEPATPPAEEPLAPPTAATPLAPSPVAATPAAAPEPAPDERDDEKTPPAHDPDSTSPIEHVFLIALGDADLTALAKDETAAPYLAGTLAKSGTLLSDYRTVARGGLADRIALISGQGPTPQTLDDCATYGDVRPADALSDGQTGGDGCVYGPETGHLGDQLSGLERTWKAYVEPAAGASRASAPERETARTSDAGRGPIARASAACDAGAGTTRRNPFLWFRGTVEADDCDERNVPLAQLAKDLRTAETTPALSWIASDAQQSSADADRFLERIVPQIQDSPAYADGGLIVIVGGQPPTPAPTPPPQRTTPQPQPPATRSGRALGPVTYPNVGDAAAAGAGVPVGALLISPRTPSGKVDATPANAFTLLRTLQQIYGVDPLGYAGAKAIAPLPKKLFSVDPQPDEPRHDGTTSRGEAD